MVGGVSTGMREGKPAGGAAVAFGLGELDEQRYNREREGEQHGSTGGISAGCCAAKGVGLGAYGA